MPLAPSAGSTSAAPSLPFPVDEATLFPEGDGFFEKRAKAARRKLLDALTPVLARGLAPGERVRFLAVGVRYAFWEAYFARLAAEQHNRTALVVTDRRLLLLQVTTRNKPADLKSQIRLGRIRKAGTRFTGIGWKLELADGTTLSFIRIPKKDRARLERLLLEPTAPAAAAPGWSSAPVPPPLPATSWDGTAGTAALEHLCPACLGLVPGPVGALRTCPAEACRIPFRDPRRAALLSAAIPGLGSLYLRHTFFGAMEFLVSMGLLGVGVGWAAAALLTGDPGELVAAALLAGVALVVPRLVDWRLTVFMGKKGIVPLAERPAPGAQARNLPAFPRWSPLLFLAGLALAATLGGLVMKAAQESVSVRQVERLARDGQFELARERLRELDAKGRVDVDARVRIALAFLEGGDLVSSDELQAGWAKEQKVERELARRWNAALAREQDALTRFRKGVGAIAKGDEATAFAQLDPTFAYFRTVRRPHFPRSRDELFAHLAGDALAEPVGPQDLVKSQAWLGRADGAPAPERALVRAALASLAGDGKEARAQLEAGAGEAPSPSFGLLRLETRARVAAAAPDPAEAKAVAEEARKLLAAGPRAGDVERLKRLAGAAQ
jgi:hypothetical protein